MSTSIVMSVLNSYSFDLYPASLYGNQQAAKLLGITDYSSAQAAGFDVAANHAKAYPYLPSGTPDDPSQYRYFTFLTQSGSKVIIPEPWIKDSTIVQVESVTIVATIPGITSDKLGAVLAALVQAGFTTASVAIKV